LPLPGDRVGDFGLEEAIGAGGMGAVFRAVDIKLDRQIALKILPPDQAIDPDVVQRYYQEGRAAARLDHENIARVYSIGHDGRFHYIAFEYIEGTTIRQRVEAGGPLAVNDAINYTLQIANALVHSSSRSVVHRDIKPSNIIVTPQGRAKLVDMGLARRFERDEDNGLTQSGMTLGTFDYISPEQARDPRDVDVRGDLYSLGCTLFHMLSGRPPFPEGTVLQKLLQHQEEPPPEIRTLNPAVPDDLAAILVKLMAKDRDRRYQTPEQLVRDLLTLAGSLGLRSLNPEGLVWMAPIARPAPAWARQLVWSVPALSFLLIVGAMAWWGDPVGPPVPVLSDTLPDLTVTRPRALVAPADTAPKPPTQEPPRLYRVESRDDLRRIVAEAPPKSTILLSDRGPYEIRGAGTSPWKGLDLTIRAEAGIRPVLRVSSDRGGLATEPPSPWLDLIGGRLTIEGVEFASEGAEPSAWLRAEDSEVTVRRSTFRASSGSPGRPRTAAIAFKSADRSGSLAVESSEFEPGQVAIFATGPGTVSLRDCTFGPAPADRATFWAENLGPGSSPATFRIKHISVLAGAGPVFRFDGIAPKVRATDSAFAPPTPNSSPPTLVVADAPEQLDWVGDDNLYGRFGVYLESPKASSTRAPIRTFAGWADDPASFRESGSILVEGQPWHERDPLEALASGTPPSSRDFQLALPRPTPGKPGARLGPAGTLPAPVAIGSAARVEGSRKPTPGELGDRPIDIPSQTREVASTADPSAPTLPRPATAESEDGMRAMPLTLPGERATKVDDPETPGELVAMPMPTEPDLPQAIAPTPPASTSPLQPVLGSPTVEPRVIRNADDFRDALNQGGPGTGTRTLIVASGADWTLPACRVRGMSSWVIRAEKGPSRPRIRFRPEPVTAGVAGFAEADSWSPWMTMQASGLRLEGIDLVLPAPDPEMPASSFRKRAAFALATGTVDLALVDCSVTIEGDAVPSAVVALIAGDLGGAGRVRIKDCLLRTGGDLVDVAGGRRLDLEVDDAAIGTGGAMVHAHGLPEGRSSEELKIVLRQVTARMQGGLTLLQSSALEPELPVASINARDAILATGDPDAPLLRILGQGKVDDLRPLIHWEGRAVGYHRLNIYRRDESAQPGASPINYDRDFWNFTLGPRDEAPIHGDLKFLDNWPAGRSPWTLIPDDFQLQPDSQALGADLMRLPDPSGRHS